MYVNGLKVRSVLEIDGEVVKGSTLLLTQINLEALLVLQDELGRQLCVFDKAAENEDEDFVQIVGYFDR